MMNQSAGDREERSRLTELWSCDIIGTRPEAQFDELVRLAAGLCQAPVAAVSLVDSDRLWFKARLGLPVDELNRDGSFCDVVVTSRSALLVENAALDPRFSRSGLVCGATHVRAYIGFPLTMHSGAVVGSLCVIDTEPRAWSELQREAIRVLAAQVVAHLELRRANAELTQLWEDHRALETRALTGTRDDQRHLAAELHDGLGQDLTGLSLLVKALRRSTQEPTTQRELLRIEQLTRSAIDSCRRLARGHLAFGFKHGSLRESLEQYLGGVNDLRGVRCELVWSTTVALRERTVAYNLYRIAQEAVTNAVRRSGGDTITVTVAERDGTLRLQVDDNGRGMADSDGGDGGVGLETMRFRAQAIGGSFTIGPCDPRGVSIRCDVALPSSRSSRVRAARPPA